MVRASQFLAWSILSYRKNLYARNCQARNAESNTPIDTKSGYRSSELMAATQATIKKKQKTKHFFLVKVMPSATVSFE